MEIKEEHKALLLKLGIQEEDFERGLWDRKRQGETFTIH